MMTYKEVGITILIVCAVIVLVAIGLYHFFEYETAQEIEKVKKEKKDNDSTQN